MAWYSHLFQNFPKFVVIHTVKGFGIVNKAEIDVFWNSLAFSMIQRMLAIWRREWQTTTVFLPRETHEQYEKAKGRTLKDEQPGQ